MNWKTVAMVACVLGAIWLASIGVLLFFIAGLSSMPYLLGAVVAQIGVFCVAAALLLVTNTRRPRGIDPDVLRGPTLGSDQATLDAFSLTTDEVLKHEKNRVKPGEIAIDDEPTDRPRRSIVIDERGEPYGRRRTDIPVADIKRTIEAVQQIRGAGGVPEEIITVPDWAKALLVKGEQAQEHSNGAAHDTDTHADPLDLEPVGNGADRPALPDDSLGSGAPGLSPEYEDRA
jgi:hypothetical protein